MSKLDLIRKNLKNARVVAPKAARKLRGINSVRLSYGATSNPLTYIYAYKNGITAASDGHIMVVTDTDLEIEAGHVYEPLVLPPVKKGGIVVFRQTDNKPSLQFVTFMKRFFKRKYKMATVDPKLVVKLFQAAVDLGMQSVTIYQPDTNTEPIMLFGRGKTSNAIMAIMPMISNSDDLDEKTSDFIDRLTELDVE